MSKTEIRPGRFASETGNWYFSCDTGREVLVGIQRKKQWTCPIVGMRQYRVSDVKRARLRDASITIAGVLRSISLSLWNEILGLRELPGWGELEEEPVVFLETDTEYVVRLHSSFE